MNCSNHQPDRQSMRCLVTGASGFLGSWLVRQLLARGHSVSVLMRAAGPTPRTADWFHRVRIVPGSFDDLAELRRSLAEEPVEVIFHLAWSGVTAGFRNQADQITTNVAGTLALWALARDCGAQHWIGLGSQAEYGPSREVLREDMLTLPVSAYGMAKLACGMLTEKISYLATMRHTHIRLLSAYGPGDDLRNMIPSVTLTLLEGGRPAMTAGEQLWDYVYVEDAARALCLIAETKATGILNLGSGETVEIREVADRIRNLVDPALSLGVGELSYGANPVMYLKGDISRLQTATGWQPEIPLQEGLRRTVEWFRNQPRPASNG